MNNRDTFGSTPELARTSSSSDNSISDNIGRSSSETVQNSEQNGKYALSKIAADAKSYFGTTYNWNEAGYILTDGSRLDFSGKHEGGQGGYRSVDHRDVLDSFADQENYDGNRAMVEFMRQGNIRVSPESGGINLSVAPTKAQETALSSFISKNRGEVIVDIDDANGNTIETLEFDFGTHSSRVLRDINNYFENGKKKVSEIAQFHSEDDGKYALRKDIVDFGRGNVYIKVGANLYNADVVVGYTSNNNMVFYDLVGLKSQNNENTPKSSLDGRKTTEDGNSLMYSNSISDNVGRSETEPVQNDEQSGKTALRKDILEMNEDELRTRVSELEQQNQNLAKSMYEGVIAPSKTKMLNIAKNLINKYGSKYPSSSLAKGLFDRLVEIDTGFDRNGKKLNQWEIERNLKNTLRPVIQEAIEVDRERYDELSEVRKEIRSLELSPE